MKEYIVEVYEDRVEWFNKDGKRHREDGPAVEHANGNKAYWINGKLHRENGPAVEFADGYTLYYINGKYLTREEFDNRNVKELNVGEIEKLLGYKSKNC